MASKHTAKRPRLESPVPTVRSDDVNKDLQTAVEEGANLAVPGSFEAGNKKKDAFDKLFETIAPAEKKQAREDKIAFMQCAKILGHHKVKPADNGGWNVDGIKTPLRHHQVMGAGWMKQKETARNCIGGLVGDQMGLGKTLTTLAMIVNTLPSTSAKIRATLIVVPPNIAHQWKAEVLRHCEKTDDDDEDAEGLTPQMFRPDDNPGSLPIRFLQQFAIVIAGYTDVVASWNTRKANGDYGGGPLHKAKWFRVCLDESQAIKNCTTAASIACRNLQTQYAWCLTGTPVMNGLDEFYPVFDFIKHPIAKSVNAFNNATADSSVFMKTHLNDIMIRRTYASKLFGSRLVEMPSTSKKTIEVKHGELESELYKFVRDRFKIWAHKLDASTNKRQARAFMFELITRLRQMTSHPINVQYVLVALLQKDDVQRLMEIVNPELYTADQDKDLAVHMRKVINRSLGPDSKQAKQAARLKLVSAAAGIKADVLMPTGEQPCERCKQVPREPHITSCLHIYCAQCLEEMSREWASHELDGCLCIAPGCGTLFETCEEYFPDLFQGDVDGDGESSGEADESFPNSIPSNDALEDLTKALRKCRLVPAGDVEDWVGAKGKIWDSAKTSMIRRLLGKMLDNKDVKVLIFTQWLPMVKVLECVCKEEGWASCCYTGHMNSFAKDRAIKKFSFETETRVMIATLKAAGVGLNLTAASRVINMDSWWNTALEQQAFSRVYRIGQLKRTEMFDMTVKGTVEEKMAKIKNKKEQEINGVVQNTLSMGDMTAMLDDEET